MNPLHSINLYAYFDNMKNEGSTRLIGNVSVEARLSPENVQIPDIKNELDLIIRSILKNIS